MENSFTKHLSALGTLCNVKIQQCHWGDELFGIGGLQQMPDPAALQSWPYTLLEIGLEGLIEKIYR